jgi:hypothetical protein
VRYTWYMMVVWASGLPAELRCRVLQALGGPFVNRRSLAADGHTANSSVTALQNSGKAGNCWDSVPQRLI